MSSKIAVVCDSYHSYKNFMRHIEKQDWDNYFFASTSEVCKGIDISEIITYGRWYDIEDNFKIVQDLKTRIRIK
jgi:hypothetical protein